MFGAAYSTSDQNYHPSKESNDATAHGLGLGECLEEAEVAVDEAGVAVDEAGHGVVGVSILDGDGGVLVHAKGKDEEVEEVQEESTAEMGMMPREAEVTVDEAGVAVDEAVSNKLSIVNCEKSVLMCSFVCNGKACIIGDHIRSRKRLDFTYVKEQTVVVVVDGQRYLVSDDRKKYKKRKPNLDEYCVQIDTKEDLQLVPVPTLQRMRIHVIKLPYRLFLP